MKALQVLREVQTKEKFLRSNCRHALKKALEARGRVMVETLEDLTFPSGGKKVKVFVMLKKRHRAFVC